MSDLRGVADGHPRRCFLSGVLSCLLALATAAGLTAAAGTAHSANDSVFIQGAAVPAAKEPSITIPSVRLPVVPPVPSTATPAVAPVGAPSVTAPAAVPQPDASRSVPATVPAAAPVIQPEQTQPPVVTAPQPPKPPRKSAETKKHGNKKNRKGSKEKPAVEEKAQPAAEEAAVPLKHAAATKTEEAAEAYAKGDYAHAAGIWRNQAEAGDGQAMNNLGVLYDLGQGVERDTGLALRWFAQSAKTGHASGMSNYGRMLEQGRGIAANPEEAARWFDLAARQGQPEAQYNLGMLYELGRGVQKDDRAAAAWYSRAAAQQQTEALARLGHFYGEGRGVVKNASRAALLLYAAAMNGNHNAIEELEAMAKSGPPRPPAVLFGQRLDATDRAGMRTALKNVGATAIREDDAFICDQYEAANLAPGAHRMSICYAPGQSGRLGFLEMDYPAPDNAIETQMLKMVSDRFGPASAGEGDDAHLWNLGAVIVATRYEPTRGLMSLMYMVPRVYYLTKQN